MGGQCPRSDEINKGEGGREGERASEAAGSRKWVGSPPHWCCWLGAAEDFRIKGHWSFTPAGTVPAAASSDQGNSHQGLQFILFFLALFPFDSWTKEKKRTKI